MIDIGLIYQSHRPGGPAGEPLRLWSHARVVRETDAFIEGDIRVFDEAGDLLAEIRVLRCQAVAEAKAAPGTEDYLYEYRWHEQPAAGDAAAPEGPGCWLVLADRAGVGKRLADRLREQGQRPVLVRPGEDYDRLDADSFQICPGQPQDAQRLLEYLGAGEPSCRGIVHLWALDTPAGEETIPEELESTQETDCLTALYLVQACAGRNWREPPRLWLVTRGRQAVLWQVLLGSPRRRCGAWDGSSPTSARTFAARASISARIIRPRRSGPCVKNCGGRTARTRSPSVARGVLSTACRR
jgi:hypothetical protein